MPISPYDGYTAGSNWIRANQPVVVTNVSALRALDKTKISYAVTKGYYTEGDGGAGEYWYDSSDTTSTDNGGSVILAADGGRWKLLYNNVISAKQFGLKCDSSTDDSSFLSKLDAFCSANNLYISIPAATKILIQTSVSSKIVDCFTQLFTTDSLVTISNNEIRPEWFGASSGCLTLAIKSLPSTGGVVLLSKADYNHVGQHKLDTAPPSSGGVFVGNTKPNVTIKGSGMPVLSDDATRFITGSGSVIQGAFINFADGFRCSDVGIDAGDYVVGTLNAGTYTEGFVAGTHKLDTAWNDPAASYINDVHFWNIKVNMKKPIDGNHTTEKHACLIERIDGGSHGYLELIGGTHGYVMKSRNVNRNGTVRAWGQVTSSAIFKTDTYSECRNSFGGDLIVGNEDITYSSGRIEFQAAQGTRLKGISFGVTGINFGGILRVYDGSTTPMEDVTITRAYLNNTTATGLTIPSVAVNWNIGTFDIQVAPYGLVTEAGCVGCNIGSGQVLATTYDGVRLAGDIIHGRIYAKACGGYGVYNNGAIISPKLISGTGNTNGLINCAFDAGGVVQLANSWADDGNGWYRVELQDNTVVLKGQIKSGTADKTHSITSGYRPKVSQTFLVSAYSSGSYKTLPIAVSASGDITIIGGGAVSSAGGWVNLDGVSWEYEV